MVINIRFCLIFVDFNVILEDFSQKFLASLTNFSEAVSQKVF